MAITFNHNDQVYVKDGNLGVGTASPGHLLEVRGTSDALSVGDDTNTQTYMRFSGSRTMFGYTGADAAIQGGSGKGIRFNVNDDSFNSGTAMYITSGGNVGIGTTSPDGHLHVYSASPNPTIVGKFENPDGQSIVEIQSKNNTLGILQFGDPEDGNPGAIQYDHSGNSMRFKTGDGERVRITSTGNVGIGTTSPNEKLSVNGNIESLDTFILNYGNNGIKWQQLFDGANSWNLRYFNGSWSSAAMTVTDTGNVGIGTTSPDAKLHVKSSGNGTYVVRGMSSSGTDLGGLYQSTSGDGEIYLKTSAVTTNVRISSNNVSYFNGGNVGIGTTSPAAKLTVKGADGINAFKVTDSGDGDGFKVTSHTTQGTYIQAYDASHTQTIILDARTDSASRHTYFNGGGNVGIGTTSPSQKLTVSGNIYSSGTLYVDTVRSATGSDIIVSRDDSSKIVRLGSGDADDKVYIYAGGGADPKVYVGTNGNVGIGTTSPSAKLHVHHTSEEVLRIDSGTTGAIHFFENTTRRGILGYSNGTSITTAADAGDMVLRAESGSKLHLAIAGTSRLTVSGSNIGIGTSTPDRQLQVHESTSGTSTAKFTNSTTGEDGDTGFFVGINGSEEPILYGYNDTDMRIATNGTERLRITSGGNVGIGTTSPTHMLDITTSHTGNGSGSTIRINRPNNSSYENAINWATGGTNKWFLGSDNDSTDDFHLYNWDASEFALTVKSSNNNVGIGTTSPASKLHVVGDARVGDGTADTAVRSYFSDGTYTEMRGYGLQFNRAASYIRPTADKQKTMYFGTDGKTWTQVSFNSSNYYFDEDATTHLSIVSGGNVGIGSTAPAAKLNVASTGANAYSSTITKGTNMKGIINALSNNADDMVGIYFGTGTTSEGTHWSGITGSRSQSATDWSTQLNFYTHDENLSNINDATQKMVIKGSGNVGIGTTSPENILHIQSPETTSTSNAYINIFGGHQAAGGSDTDGEAGFIFKHYAGSSTYYRAGAIISAREQNYSVTSLADSYLRFETAENNINSERMRITSAGNVGIGTTSPQDLLHLSASSPVLRLTNTSDTGKSSIEFWDNQAGTSQSGEIFYEDSGNVFGLQGNANGIIFKASNTFPGSELMRLTSSGNLGIGTTSPSTSLHVVKDASWEVARFEADSYPTATVYSQAADKYAQLNIYDTRINSEPTMELRADTPHFNIRLDDTGNVLTILDGGNVGIGTTSPSQKLHVVGKALITDDIQLTGSNPRIDFNSNGASSLRFYDTTNASERMRIDSSGNVGIGTTSPDRKLHVNSGTTNHVAIFESTDATAWIQIKDDATASYISNTDNGLDFAADSNNEGANSNIKFHIDGSEKMRITDGGNVGIGTTSPQQALHIKGATNGLMMLEGDNDNGLAGCYYKTEDTDNTMNRTKGFFGFTGNNAYGNGYFTMWLDNANDNGQVTASEERFRWERDGDFHADGDVIAYSTTTPSDIRLKTDVETIESASEKVSKLRGVEYTWSKGKLAGQREIGLIAQEVEAVVPEVVKEKELPLWDNSGESYKTVDYEKLVALLIESNKEMQEEIKQLKERLDGITE